MRKFHRSHTIDRALHPPDPNAPDTSLDRPHDAGETLALHEAMQEAKAAYERGEWDKAEHLCRLVLNATADHFDALHLGGLIAARKGNPREAADLLSKAVSINPNHATAFYHYGVALDDLQNHSDALKSYERALALEPNHVRAHNNRGIALSALRRHSEALESYDRAIALKPDHAQAHNNRGVALADLKHFAEALECYGRAIAFKPDFAEAHNNRGVALGALQHHAEALGSYDVAIALKPDYAEAHSNRGVALGNMRRYAEALDSYGQALALKPDYSEAYNNHGVALAALGRSADALESYGQALRLNPDYDFLYGRWLHARMRVCDWKDISKHFVLLNQRIERGERVSPPFPVIAMPGSLAIQKRAAEIWVEHKHPPRRDLPAIRKRPARDRIHVGYFSADLHEHATSHLIAGLFEHHDRSRFRITAFSFGPDTGDAMRKRLSVGLDNLIDVRDRTDIDVALLARDLGVDIAVDLKGFTQHARTNIFALRAAPIQVSFLGYPGTMGARYIDYLIADGTLVPETHRQHYVEAIAYLPNSYQPNDDTRRIADRLFSRADLGLRAAEFVFCCFNSCYKITPETFDAWMRILGRVDGSVLWLLEDNALAASNLRKEAAQRGVGPDRLVFAPLLPQPEHLARHRAADLFLDTFPCNAHTTASDALWTGLPVLTCLGETFAGRVAASLLNGVRLPQLIAQTSEQYEDIAIGLATDPRRLKDIGRTLVHNVRSAPLFDIRLFARHLEAAYTAMHERYMEDALPDHLHVQG
jgi:protein O-GlcNAc transferase